MSRESEFFLNSRSSVVRLELMEISHSSFSETYRIVRNARDGVTVDLSDDEEGVEFTYYPARVERLGASDDLESSVRISIGDLGEVVPSEMDAVAADGAFMEKPRLRYWIFRSDDLSAPIFGPHSLEVPSFTFTEEGAAFEARAPVLNSAKTGERFTLDRFPMLRGFL